MEEFKSTHDLKFESRPWKLGVELSKLIPGSDKIMEFKVGTCNGQWFTDDNRNCFVILSIINHSPGNGHTDDIFEWFENSCKSYKYDLVVEKLMNQKFKMKLLSNGFEEFQKDSVIKRFT